MKDILNELKHVAPDKIYHNLGTSSLIEHSILNEGAILNNRGAVVVNTGKYTGRSPQDKFFVEEITSKENIYWGNVNQKIREDSFSILYDNVLNYLKDKKVYAFDGVCGNDKKTSLNVRFICEKAWHCHFARNMFHPYENKIDEFVPGFTLIDACNYKEKEWGKLGLNSETFVVFNIAKRTILIGSTEYAGEIKKAIFTIMNYLLPLQDVFPMHCSANTNRKGETVLFFGLSGTGKTTLSTVQDRIFIGDDEHGWSSEGIFNFEGGCYAKCIDLSLTTEPTIWNALNYTSILENVACDTKTREVNFHDGSFTENTRASYGISLLEQISPGLKGDHPQTIIFLTADAFGVLPPVAKLNKQQASYYFLSGYTSKIAGTERGIIEPQATFSMCFGEPFMVHFPKVYQQLLEKKIEEYNCNIYLVNTGWTGGFYGVGNRIPLILTRIIVTSILDRSIERCKFITDDAFQFQIPTSIVGVNKKVLFPRETWVDKKKYDQVKEKLIRMFIKNFDRFSDIQGIRESGPKI